MRDSSPEEQSLLADHAIWSTARQRAPTPPTSDAHTALPASGRSCSQFMASQHSRLPADLPAPPASRAYRRHTAPHAVLPPVSEAPHSPQTVRYPVTRHHSYRQHGNAYYGHPSRAASPHPHSDPQPHPGYAYASQQQQRSHFMYMQANYADTGLYHAAAHPHEARHPYGPPAGPHGTCIAATMPHHIVRNPMRHPAAVGDAPVYAGRRLLTAEEKEMRRKVSHSAIEKRRRERTNAVLRDLQDIIPGLPRSGKIQKLEILEAATEYIRQLKHCGSSSVVQSAPHTYDRPPSADYDAHDGCPDTADAQRPIKLPAFAYAANMYSDVSDASESTRDGSGEDTLTNPADMLDQPESPLSSPTDPSSMDVRFLLT
ncbi:hypothetical protein H4R19_000680 [Coemansia spiralis]|nr:hypothetical protein H4R19_000680 [Coemansia spiralis]